MIETATIATVASPYSAGSSRAEMGQVRRQLVAGAGRLAALAAHEAVKLGQVRPRPTLGEDLSVVMDATFSATAITTNWLMLVPSRRLRRSTAALSETGSRSG